MIKNKIYIILIFCSIIGCNSKNNDAKSFFPMANIIKLDSLNRPINKQDLYFPIYEFEVSNANITNNTNDDTVFCRLYSQSLYALEEPILSSKYLGKDMYRFFLGHEKIIRVIKEEDKMVVIIKNLDPTKNVAETNSLLTECFSLSKTYWDTLAQLANKTLIWNLPDNMSTKEVSDSPYYLEGHREAGYSFLGPSRISEKLNYAALIKIREFFYKIEQFKPKKGN